MKVQAEENFLPFNASKLTRLPWAVSCAAEYLLFSHVPVSDLWPFLVSTWFFFQVSGLPTEELFPFSHACKTVLTVGLRRLAGKCSFKKAVQCKGKNEWKSSPEYRKMIWKEIPLGCQPSSAVANTENTQRPFPRQQQDAPGLMLGMLNERCLTGCFTNQV